MSQRQSHDEFVRLAGNSASSKEQLTLLAGAHPERLQAALPALGACITGTPKQHGAFGVIKRMNKAVAIIGGGPAGLMAAEVLSGNNSNFGNGGNSNCGIQVDLYDAMPSLGRKFLMAGKGGTRTSPTPKRLPFFMRVMASGATKSRRCSMPLGRMRCATGFMDWASTPLSAPPGAYSQPT